MCVAMCGCIFHARTIRAGYALREVFTYNYVCIILLYPPLEFHCSTYEHAVFKPKYIRVVEDYACTPLDGRTRCTWSVNDLIFNFHTHIYTGIKIFYRTYYMRTCYAYVITIFSSVASSPITLKYIILPIYNINNNIIQLV